MIDLFFDDERSVARKVRTLPDEAILDLVRERLNLPAQTLSHSQPPQTRPRKPSLPTPAPEASVCPPGALIPAIEAPPEPTLDLTPLPPPGGNVVGNEGLQSPPDSHPNLTGDKRRDRQRRKRSVRAKTISIKRISKGLLAAERENDPAANVRRLPLVRGICAPGDGICPFITCKHHLFLDVSPKTGSIKFNFPDLIEEDGTIRFEEMPATCVLDVADNGPITLEKTGEILNMTRERVRQVDCRAMAKLAKYPELREAWSST